VLDDKEGNPEKRSLDESQSGILEKHTTMAKRSARNLDVREAVKELEKCKEILEKLTRTEDFEGRYEEVGKTLVNEIIQKIKKAIEERAREVDREFGIGYRDNAGIYEMVWSEEERERRLRRERIFFEGTMMEQYEFERDRWISANLSPILERFSSFLEKSQRLLIHRKEIQERQETKPEPTLLSKSLPWQKLQRRKNIQQCRLVEHFLAEIFILIKASVENIRQVPVIDQKEPEAPYYWKEALDTYMEFILNQLPEKLSDYFIDRTVFLYVEIADNPNILTTPYSFKLVKYALDFFGRKGDLENISKIVGRFIGTFEGVNKHAQCGEILQFRAEFSEKMAGKKDEKERPLGYLGEERYLWMAAMDFKKASSYFREANATRKYTETAERSSSIFQELSRSKENYMFSIRPLTSEETITGLYVNTGYEDELKSIIDLTDGGNYAVIGPRGSGKSTVVNRILKEYEEKEDFLTLRLEAPRKYDTLEFFQFFYLKLAKKVEQKISHQLPHTLKAVFTIETLLRRISPFLILLLLLIPVANVLGYDISLGDFWSWIVLEITHIVRNSTTILLIWSLAVFLIVCTLSMKKKGDTNRSLLLASITVLVLFLAGKEIGPDLIQILPEIGFYVLDFLLLSFLVVIIACSLLFPYVLVDFLSKDELTNGTQKIFYFLLSVVPLVFVVLSYFQVNWFKTVMPVHYATDVFLLIFLISTYSAFVYMYASKGNYPAIIFSIPSFFLLGASGAGLLRNTVVILLVESSCLFLLIIGAVFLFITLGSNSLMRLDPSRQKPFSIPFIFLFLFSFFICRWWNSSILELVGSAAFLLFLLLAVHIMFYLLEQRNIIKEKYRMKSELVLVIIVFFLVIYGSINEMSVSRMSVHQEVFDYFKTHVSWINPFFSMGEFLRENRNYFSAFFTTEFLGVIAFATTVLAIVLVHFTAKEGNELWNRAKRIVGDLSYLTAVHEESSLGLSSIIPFAGRLKGITIQKREYTLPSISERIQDFIAESAGAFSEGVLIVIDEIDKMRSEDAVEFLNDLRGIISIKKAYFFLVSPSTFYDEFIKGIMAFEEKKSPDSAIDEIVELKSKEGSNKIEKLLRKRLSKRGIDNLEEGAISAIAILSRGIPRDAVRHLNSVFREWIMRGEKPNITIEDVIRRIFVPQVQRLCKSKDRSRQTCDAIISSYSRLKKNEDIKKVLEDKNSVEMRNLESMIRKLRNLDYSIF
jgi:hypothetical protein